MRARPHELRLGLLGSGVGGGGLVKLMAEENATLSRVSAPVVIPAWLPQPN
jgi:hypothetical protein